jgi:hypothetical protein
VYLLQFIEIKCLLPPIKCNFTKIHFMQKIFTLTLLGLIFYATLSAQQAQVSKDWYLKVSGGSVSFGTGVFSDGYGIGIDVSKNIVKQPKPGLGRLLLGGELLFEQGVNSPKMGVLTEEEGSPFFSFYQVSSSTLWPKVSYHPFHKGFSGFTLQVGPTIGYTFKELIQIPPTPYGKSNMF